MTTNVVASYLKYANLQMAAEADLPADFVGDIPVARLTEGNHRSSRFTDTSAAQFNSDGWTVAAHQADTSTGFSGTLFKNKATGELVLSFRSTDSSTTQRVTTKRQTCSRFSRMGGRSGRYRT